MAYYIVPKWLLTGRYTIFFLAVIVWGVFGWYLNIYYRLGVFFPVFDNLNWEHSTYAAEPASFLCMTTTVGSMSVSSLAKRWVKKQQEWFQAEKEKVAAQLQLLKAQLHPHFLFNTLNNIYSFALESSPKTPQMILKLSSLLSYMLYECRTEEVLLEKEVEIMKNYIDLEKERYGDKIDISVNIEGDIEDKYITPLLMLPFLENAFKHGTSEQLERPWLSVDIAVRGQVLNCKVVNSKNEIVPFGENGVGIANVKKRLQLLYHGKYELKLADEGDFFVVMLTLQLQAPVITMQTDKEQSRMKYV
jgi:LytS/YehU family sensor histidine kinase